MVTTCELWLVLGFGFFLQSCKHLLKWLILSMSSLIQFSESTHMTEDGKVYKCLQDLTIAFYQAVHWIYS